MTAIRARRSLALSPTAWITWAGVTVFLVFVTALIVAVVVSSFGTVWLGTWLPAGFTGKWWEQTWSEFGLGSTLLVTMEVALLVVVISVALGVPAAYVLARRNFPGKRVVSLLLLLPLLVPPITYGIPLATLLYQWGLGGNMTGVVLANVVPSLPFVVLTMTPFVEQIDRRVEDAARTLGAGTPRILVSVLGPLLLPGILAGAVMVLVRTVGMFELTFLTSGADSQTLVVALYAAKSGAGIRADQTVDAIAVVYMLSTVLLLLVALRFVNPTQLITRVKDD
ncbi:ABC transporter permease [Actinocrispum wychmicini]|uniref:Putative spermidine/putrescine transport system permease protein n=1 Tax=Actinocrispum wychmicini TaxID=1213861 RepID=A0A4R2JVI0_9PSEU|nr:ABC transporter permease subunit [Actinocrispum wychmicini]TCO64433.1 putative spermidine/putrescine transport system permease protein [Actinocrispum wychmicini]